MELFDCEYETLYCTVLVEGVFSLYANLLSAIDDLQIDRCCSWE